MKVKKLIAAAVPVALLLSGCVTVKDSANKEEKTEETSKSKASETKGKSTNSKEESNDVQKVRVFDEDYAQYLLDIEQDMLRRFDYYDGNTLQIYHMDDNVRIRYAKQYIIGKKLCNKFLQGFLFVLIVFLHYLPRY